MSRRLSSEVSHPDQSSLVIGGGQRVARIFVPAYNNRTAIRLPVNGPHRASARRRLARLLEPRRMAS